MLFNKNLAPLSFVFLMACGESTAFTETELGRFVVTVAGEGDPSVDAKSGTIPMDEIEGGYDETNKDSGHEITSDEIVEAALSDAASGNGVSSKGNNKSSGESLGQGTADGSSDKNVTQYAGKKTAEESKAGTAATSDEAKNGSAPGSNSSPSSEGEISDSQTLKLCSNLFKGKGRYIKLINASEAATGFQANAETIIAVRLSGNMSKFSLSVVGQQKLAGLCIVATGNQSVTEIDSAMDMGKIVYIARGNQAKATFNFQSSNGVDEAFINLKGNDPVVSFTGVGAAICSSLDAGKRGTVTCE